MPKNNGLILEKVPFHLSNGRSSDQMAKVIRLSQVFHGKKQFIREETALGLYGQRVAITGFFYKIY
ncbi:hypothetical protein GCM10007423_06280 [Dyadobacter endophyticus]|uniref:Uncharacterized protein n=1 Tax=Dyadobacter endophyticus TaxID=1749036 RepID=A0ABQ1YG90_9BACT|nr:hypothetical protein GCM10007423_06280 [Dyadobacter endophyticus]